MALITDHNTGTSKLSDTSTMLDRHVAGILCRYNHRQKLRQADRLTDRQKQFDRTTRGQQFHRLSDTERLIGTEMQRPPNLQQCICNYNQTYVIRGGSLLSFSFPSLPLFISFLLGLAHENCAQSKITDNC